MLEQGVYGTVRDCFVDSTGWLRLQGGEAGRCTGSVPKDMFIQSAETGPLYNACRYITYCVINVAMITGFRDGETEKIWEGKVSRRLPRDIQAIARRKLRMLNNAHKLDDLRIPPANRLEALKGKRKGQHSIRINDQWRICFVWSAPNAHDVEIVDHP